MQITKCNCFLAAPGVQLDNGVTPCGLSTNSNDEMSEGSCYEHQLIMYPMYEFLDVLFLVK